MTNVESELARLARRSEHPDRKRGRRVNLSPLADAPLRGAMSNVWTIGQACVWLATRNAKAAANTSKDAPLLRLQEEIAPEAGYPTVIEALELLQRRWRDGVLTIDGRKRGKGVGRQTIEQGERALLVLEYDDARQQIVAEPGRPFGNRTWWDDLAVNADDVQALWPVLAPLPLQSSAWWTVPQACIWVATRDARFCEMDDEMVRGSLWVADSVLESRADALTGPPLWLTVFEARNSLATACSRGEIDMVGRRGGIGDQQTIERFAWSHLEWSERPERDAMALIPPDLDPTAASWDTLRISADAVRARWLWNQHTAALMFPPDGLPDAAETSLADAWRWCLFDAAMKHDNGPSRVNWKELGDYIDGKLRNAFLAGRLECLGRLDPLLYQWSPLPRDWFRLAIEIDPKRNRLVPQRAAEMCDFGPAWEAGAERVQDLRVNVDALRRWWVEVATPALSSSGPIDQSTPATVAIVATDDPEPNGPDIDEVNDEKARRPHTAKASQKEHDRQFEKYRDECVAAGESPNVNEDEPAARKLLGDRYDRERWRDSRRRLKPDGWSSTGKRKGWE